MHLWQRLMVIALVWAGAAATFNCQDVSESRYNLSVDVNLVSVTTAVTDESGRSINDLMVEDFQLIEDGQEQKISLFSHESQTPISLGLLVDISSSSQDKL